MTQFRRVTDEISVSPQIAPSDLTDAAAQGFKLVINLNSSTQTLQNTEVEVLDVEFTPDPDENAPSYLVNRSETAEMLAAL